jgi:hypothetical protein
MAVNMLSTPAYTEEMAQQGQFSREVPVPDMSLFNPQGPLGGDRIASPVSTEYVGTSEDAPAIDAFMRANGINDIVQGRAAYYNQQQQQQQPPNPYGGMTPGDALGGGLTMQQPTPGQQLNTPSFDQLAQPTPVPGGIAAGGPFVPPPVDYSPPPPPPSVTLLPITQPTPGTSNLINQISAPVTQAPTQLPVTSPGANNLIQQIKAPTQIKPVATPNPATRQFAQQFRPQPVARPQPIMAPKPIARPQPVMATRPVATSVSRVNPPLLPSRPMGRR